MDLEVCCQFKNGDFTHSALPVNDMLAAPEWGAAEWRFAVIDSGMLDLHLDYLCGALAARKKRLCKLPRFLPTMPHAC